MAFPLSILLVLFGIVVIFFLVFSFFNIYHALRYGYATAVNVTVLIVYVLVSGVLLVVAGTYVSIIDWSSPISMLEIFKELAP